MPPSQPPAAATSETQPSDTTAAAPPDLISSRTRSKTRDSVGVALAAVCLKNDDADGIILIARSSTNPPADPRSHAEAMRDDPEGWGAAESRELENHRKNGTFELINRSSTTGSDAKRKRLVPLTWVYKRKRSGILKARLCVVGCAQRPGVDFDQVTCNTLQASSLRMLAALAALDQLHMRRWDFEAAYLQGDLEVGESVDCSAPPGHATTGDDGGVVVWRAQRPVYGMAQAGRRWQRSLYPWLLEFGLQQSEADPSVFYMRTTPDAHHHKDTSIATDVLYVGCYVDDLFILYKHDGGGSLYNNFTTALKQRWRVEDEGPITDLLNIEIEHGDNAVTLKQTAYITKLNKEYFPNGPPADVHASTVPHTMDIRECVLEATADGAAPADPALATTYKRLVGALLYCATQTRPDVSYPVSMLCRVM